MYILGNFWYNIHIPQGFKGEQDNLIINLYLLVYQKSCKNTSNSKKMSSYSIMLSWIVLLALVGVALSGPNNQGKIICILLSKVLP